MKCPRLASYVGASRLVVFFYVPDSAHSNVFPQLESRGGLPAHHRVVGILPLEWGRAVEISKEQPCTTSQIYGEREKKRGVGWKIDQ